MKELHIRDSNFSHSLYSSNPTPLVNFSEHIKWLRTENINGSSTIYTDQHLSESTGGIGWLLEPYEVCPHYYAFVKQNSSNFKKIWTHDKDIIETVPNSTFVPAGGCWIKVQDRKIHEKNKLISVIASDKYWLPGHKLRHEVISLYRNKFDAFGPSYTPFKESLWNKIEGLKDYMFQVTIENSRRDYYFSEKLIDCLITGTLPIYWGCPSIFKFFNKDGFLVFSNALELGEILPKCTEEYYNSRIDAIQENFRLAQGYVLSENWIAKNNLI